jgi:hypothetical protein
MQEGTQQAKAMILPLLVRTDRFDQVAQVT